MNNFFKLNRLILQTLFLYIFTSASPSLSLENLYRGKSVSDYFSGIISLQDSKYKESYNFLRNLESLEDNHLIYSKLYLETLVNNSKINEAYKYSKKLKKKNINFFQSDIVIISKLIKNNDFQKANSYLTTVN